MLLTAIVGWLRSNLDEIQCRQKQSAQKGGIGCVNINRSAAVQRAIRRELVGWVVVSDKQCGGDVPLQVYQQKQAGEGSAAECLIKQQIQINTGKYEVRNMTKRIRTLEL